MSVGLTISPVPSTVGPPPGRSLTVALDAAETGGPEREARCRVPDGWAVWRRIARAVSLGDGDGFVDAAAHLTSASVCLRDSTGAVVAARNLPGAPGRHDIALRDGSGLRGTLGLGPDVDAGPGLADLALALLRMRDAELERRTLENRLAVLGCFVDGDFDGPVTGSPGGDRRLVMIRPAGGTDPGLGRSTLRRLSRNAAGIPRLTGLSLVPHADALLGVYVDDGAGPEAHRQSWQALLSDLDRVGVLRVVVSCVASGAAGNKEQQETIDRVSQLQLDEAGYFDLPAVAVLDQLGPLTGVLRAVPGAEVLPYVARVLGDLIDDGRFGGQLIDTLYAYLQTGGSPRDAGALLHLHGSSVKYRMRVLRELLGERLDDPRKRFDIELALRMYLAGRELAGPATRR